MKIAFVICLFFFAVQASAQMSEPELTHNTSSQTYLLQPQDTISYQSVGKIHGFENVERGDFIHVNFAFYSHIADSVNRRMDSINRRLLLSKMSVGRYNAIVDNINEQFRSIELQR